MPLAKIGDIQLEYYVDGRPPGPPLLMIQGFTGRAQSWAQPLVDALAHDFTAIRFSHAGIGLSEPPASAPSMRSMADDAAALLTALGIDRAHVFGISMGGVVAQELALNHPQRVLGLALGCTTCGSTHGVQADPGVIRVLADPSGTLEERMRRSWPLVMASGWDDNPDTVAAAEAELREALERPIPPALLMQHLVAMQQFDSWDRLPSLKMPALVIHGDEDQLVPPQNANILAGRIPGAGLRMIPHTGHLFFNEKPQETAAALSEFFARVPAGV